MCYRSLLTENNNAISNLIFFAGQMAPGFLLFIQIEVHHADWERITAAKNLIDYVKGKVSTRLASSYIDVHLPKF